MKVVILTRDEPPSRYLVSHLNPEHSYTIILESEQQLDVLLRRLRRNIRRHGFVRGSLAFVGFLIELPLLLRETRSFNSDVSKHCAGFAFPESSVLHETDSVNNPDVLKWLDEIEPDAIVVYGTRIISPPLIEWAESHRVPIVNWHCGITPEYRGVKSELYCIVNREPEMLGSTVHHLSRGIDSGDVVVQRTLPLSDYSEGDLLNPAFLRCRNVELSVELLNEFLIGVEQKKIPSLSTEGRKSRLYSTPRLKTYRKLREMRQGR